MVLERVVHEIVEDYAKQNCVYLELRSTPKIFEGSSMEEYISTVIKAMKEAEEINPKIRVRYIASINRNGSLE